MSEKPNKVDLEAVKAGFKCNKKKCQHCNCNVFSKWKMPKLLEERFGSASARASAKCEGQGEEGGG